MSFNFCRCSWKQCCFKRQPSGTYATCAAIISKLFKTFHVNHVEVAEGGVEVSDKLLAQRWDYISLPGVGVGKLLQRLLLRIPTPVAFGNWAEKSLYYRWETANLKLAAKE